MSKPVVGELRVWQGRLVMVMVEFPKEEEHLPDSLIAYDVMVTISKVGSEPENGSIVKVVAHEIHTVSEWAERTGQCIVTFAKEA